MKINKLLACVSLMLTFILASINLFGQVREVTLFAHRGGRYELDENTMSAFQEAYNRGMRSFETDIRMTKDGHLVIFHDDSFQRMIGVDGGVEKVTLAELKKLRTKKGNEIPTLDEFLKFFKGKDSLYIEFEMKTQQPLYDEASLIKYCNELYKKVNSSKGPNSTFLFTSFDKRPLRYLKQKDPNVGLLFIKSEGISQALLDEAKELGVNRIGCRVDYTTRKMVEEAKKQGFTVSLWPGHTVDDFLLGVSLGSDYLCTDIPFQVIDWVKQYGQSWIKLK